VPGAELTRGREAADIQERIFTERTQFTERTMLTFIAIVVTLTQICNALPAASSRFIVVPRTPFALSLADIARANSPRPQPGSHVRGDSPADAFRRMNLVLQADPVSTAPCSEFEHERLNQVARVLYSLRHAELDTEFRSRQDRRAMHFDSIEYKEKLWQAEKIAASRLSSHAPGSPNYNATRDGKCAEAVMWWIHHLSEGDRARLAQVEDFVLPLMPHDVAPAHARANEYDQQISCTSCHLPVHIPGAPPIPPIPEKNSSDPQFPVTCPADPKTGKPTVWYNRTKRCDWDYLPFCAPCEGVGGMTWGPNEDQWLPMPCEPLLTPDQIPKENLTSPLWPKSFSVYEKALLTFPGRDPCAVDFKNQTYNLYFETTADGPIYHTVGITGGSGPSPVPGTNSARCVLSARS
jgi:hypothetical protein